jgi:hypothetical protein
MNQKLKKISLATVMFSAALLMSFSDSSAGKRKIGEAGAISQMQATTLSATALEEESCLPNVARWVRQLVENVLEAVGTRTCEPEYKVGNLAQLESLSVRKIGEL